MSVYDVLFTLDEANHFQAVSWGNERAKRMFQMIFEGWIARQKTVQEVFRLPFDRESGRFHWDEEEFSFLFLNGPTRKRYLLLSRENHREELFARALDQIPDGVQIYDHNACVVYFNKVSRGISQIPDGIETEGRHLLDLYNLDEDISTTMTALRTRAPVINRVDRYTSSDGKVIATSNTSYPILRDGELLGAVVFEQTEDIVKTKIQKMEETGQALKAFSARGRHVSFSGYTFDNVIGSNEKMRAAVELAQKVAQQNSSVFLVGETGTGKEVFAQSIHRASPRRGKKFLAINCAAIPDTLIEGLLFGTQKGSFTGSETKPGYLEEANGGTLFLDELNSMSMTMQAKILRVIQENTFRRLGGTQDIPLDVLIISSCNEDPFQAIAANRFRRDLFYRLSTVMIELPALREHLEDLEELVNYHLRATAYQYVNSITTVDPQVWQILRRHDWPGNVRELFHALDYAQNVADSSTMLPENLPSYLRKHGDVRPAPATAAAEFDFSKDTLQSLLDEYECQIIRQALDHCGYNISRTAQTLGILRQSLQYRIRKYGIVI